MVINRRKFKAISSKCRARDPQEKELRRQALLDAGRKLLAKFGGKLPPVSEIAKQAGVSKATVYLYFDTKEELFLNIHAQMVREWLTKVAAAIDRFVEGENMDAIINMLSEQLSEDPDFIQLSVITSGVLEKKVGVDALLVYKTAFVESVLPVLTSLIKAVPGINGTQLRTLIIQTYSMILGLWQMSVSAEIFDEAAKKNPLISQFKVDMNNDLRNAMRLIWGQILEQ